MEYKINFIKKILASFKTDSIAFDTFYTSLWHITSKCIGFLIPYFIAIKYGVSDQTDAFFIAYAVIWFLCVVFSSAGQLTLVPFIAEKKSKKEDLNVFITNIIKTSFFVILIILIIFLVLSKFFLNLVNTSIQRDTKAIFDFILILSPTVLFYTYGGIFEGYLNYHKKFWIYPLSLAFRSLTIIIIFLLFSTKLNIYSVAIGYLIGEFVLLLNLYFVSVKKLGYKFVSLLNEDTTDRLKHFFKIAFFQIAFTVLTAINPLIDKTIAFIFAEGNLSILEYAEKIYLIFYNAIAVIFSKVLLSYWSDSYFLEPMSNLRNKILDASKKTILFCLPICIIVFLFKFSIANIIFNRGNINAEQVMLIASLVGVFIYQLIPAMIFKIFVNYYVINKLTTFLLATSVVRVILNVFFDIICINLFGIIGIVYSTLIHTTISIALFLLYFYKSNKVTP
ncbi:MAG: hypothetical protein HYR97_05225 [Candidatus Melainabacteria bacterium]|nr:hypothetical protein [Candidatus Melainabacteria bacterium]